MKKDAYVTFGEMAKTYGQQYVTPDLTLPKYPANVFRLNVFINLLNDIKPNKVLDIGCGTADPLLAMRKHGHDVHGFDFAEEMVEVAKGNVRDAGYPEDIIFRDNMEDIQNVEPEQFDCAIALGAVYYARDFPKTIQGIADLLPSGGHMIISLRNDLFSMFSMNDYSVEYMYRTFFPNEGVSDDLRGQLDNLMQERHKVADVEKAFKTIDDRLVHTYNHNPLTVEQEILAPHGLKQAGVYYYHFHALPPIFEHTHRDEFRQLSAKLEENPADWRGMFMCSTFIVHAQKA
ncbi:MAG: methyltransferase domain-containing protein [Pseudomonadota bacterium]